MGIGWGLTIFMSVILLINISLVSVSAVRINEVELNPAGTDNGNEWIELYSSSEISLDGFYLENVKDKIMNLSGSIEGYLVITTPYNFLTNDKQKLVLYDSGGNKIDETTEISDSRNDERSWQYCSEWIFAEASKEKENNCGSEEEQKPIVNNTALEKIQTSKSIQEESVKKVEEVNSKVTVNAIESIENIPDASNSPVQVIKLEPKSIKTWKSQEARIKEWSLLGFTLLCFIILVGLWRYKIRRTNE